MVNISINGHKKDESRTIYRSEKQIQVTTHISKGKNKSSSEAMSDPATQRVAQYRKLKNAFKNTDKY